MKNNNLSKLILQAIKRICQPSFPSRTPYGLNEKGATAVEYAMALALIAGVIFTAVSTFGKAVLGLFNTLLNVL